jgi:hypothetical protein
MIIMAASQVIYAFAGVGVVYALWRTFYNLFLSPLAGIPGYRLAALSIFYEWYWDCIQPGRYCFEIMKMHKELGGFLHNSVIHPR